MQIKVINELNYSHVLMSRNKMNMNASFILERFMPLENNIIFQIKKLFVKKLFDVDL